MKNYTVKYAANFLRAADNVDQTQAMEYALDFIQKNDPTCANRYMAIFDIAQHASKKRFHTFDGLTGLVVSEEAAHGAGSEGDANDGYAVLFSNKNGSHQSSLGMYETEGTYNGKHGRSLILNGLQASNSAAKVRAIVMHGADYVRPGKEAGDSWGCPALSNATIQAAIDKLKGGSYLYIYNRKENAVGDTVQTLKFGSKGDSVRELQKLIGVKADGIFGKDTESAVIGFQNKNKLTADGVVGPATWAKLRSQEPVPETKSPVQTGKPELWYPKAIKSSGKMKTRGTYKKGFPEGAVIHWTSGHCETEKDALNTVNSAIKNQDYAFFVIGPEGKVYQNFPLNQWGYHAGTSSYKGLSGTVSDELVGIEVVCAGHVKGPKNTSWFGKNYADSRCRTVKAKDNVEAGTYVKYTDAQEKSLEQLILWMHKQAPLIFKLDLVLGHDTVAPRRKIDPGGALSMTIPEYQAYLKTKV